MDGDNYMVKNKSKMPNVEDIIAQISVKISEKKKKNYSFRP